MPFRDVPTHRRIVELLSRSVAHGTLPPSLIFAGPPGAGKRLTALAVAQALNCLTPSTQRTQHPTPDTRHPAPAPSTEHPAPSTLPTDACGTCTACVRIARGVHPDVLVVEPGDSGAIKIDQVRDIVDRAAFRPFEGRRRIVIVADADALVPAAQNALLKTLEEPPSSSVFILITSRPDVLLPTVRSRCIHLMFAGGAHAEIDRDASDIAQRVLAHVSAGADGRRLDGAKELLTKTGAGGAGDREQVASHLNAMAALLRDIEVVAARADAVGLANPDARAIAERLASTYRGERSVRAYAAIDRALAAIQSNVGVKVVADWLVLQL
jgi:DNA polymerase-3 subunit delta'